MIIEYNYNNILVAMLINLEAVGKKIIASCNSDARRLETVFAILTKILIH